MKTLLKQFFEIKNINSIKNSHQIQEYFSQNSLQKYKTELCKTFQATGNCPYGNKCRFAHGANELINTNRCQNYKQKFCKSFQKNGYCPYGARCNFIHNEKKFENSFIPYYYLQLFIHKNFGILSDDEFSDTKLLNGRLPVFENLENEKFKEFNKIKSNDRKSSISTNSNEENENELNIENYINNGYNLTQFNETEKKKIENNNYENMNNFSEIGKKIKIF